MRIESFSLKISPNASLLWHRDVEDNSVAIAKFVTPTRQLSVESEVIIQQYNEAPLDFLVEDYALNYPFSYKSEDQLLLSPYQVLPDPEVQEAVKNWVAKFWRPGEPIQTYSLLQRLAEQIYQTLSYRVREEPGVQTALQTLSLGTGSCRDFTMLFMEASRGLGLAARFVSGYLHTPNITVEPGATHAWAEVYIPGAGWKGFDPTHGNIVGRDHIAVAVAGRPESIPPIGGSFSGAQSSNLEVGVWVSLC